MGFFFLQVQRPAYNPETFHQNHFKATYLYFGAPYEDNLFNFFREFYFKNTKIIGRI